MSETTIQDLSGVAETLLIPLYIRAMESQRPDAFIKDKRAEELVRQLDQESLRETLALTEDLGRMVVILKGREFNRFAQDFLRRHPDAAVVHIGCGLDTRFERMDNGRVEWYDLDLPEVIEIRRKLVGGEGVRHHFLACSVLESAWLDTVSAHHLGNHPVGKRPFLFLAEGVFMYFEETQVKSLVLTLRDRFPGAELVFDAVSPLHRRIHNNKVARTGIGAHLHWALKHSQDLEQWSAASPTGAGTLAPHEAQRSAGVRLLDERYPFQYPELRIRRPLMVFLIPFIAKAFGVFHYQL